MKHTITFHTDDNKIKEINNIKVSFYDQDGMAYSMSVRNGVKVENAVEIDKIIEQRLKELNNGKIR